jgi:ATP-binding cassette subfamily B protein
VFVIGAMFWLNWKIALMSLSTFPLLLIATYIFKEKIKFAFRIIREKVSQMNAFVQERITGMRIIQVFNAEERERKKFEKINYDHLDANLKSVWYYSIFFPIVEIILALAIAFMVWSASTEAIKDQASIGVFTSFLLLLNMAFRPLRMLADKFNTLQMGVVSSERVFRILDLKDTTESYGTLKPENLNGNIEFKDVWFAYNDDDYVMKGVSFKVKQGEMLAIIGATGSGKTTITNLINKFYQINKGEILIDNISIDEYDLFALRKRIAIVLQDVFLFSGTIYENITLHNESISLESVIDAAKDVGAHEFIMNLPGGYQYEVMERGATLSVGQRQLIAFIRALVYNPDILILDEATSSVDRESEILIQKATEKLVSGRTSLVIAHRLSTIQKADKILVMDSGEVKEMGNHKDLIADKEGHYKKLYEMQFK